MALYSGLSLGGRRWRHPQQAQDLSLPPDQSRVPRMPAASPTGGPRLRPNLTKRGASRSSARPRVAPRRYPAPPRSRESVPDCHTLLRGARPHTFVHQSGDLSHGQMTYDEKTGTSSQIHRPWPHQQHLGQQVAPSFERQGADRCPSRSLARLTFGPRASRSASHKHRASWRTCRASSSYRCIKSRRHIIGTDRLDGGPHHLIR